MSFSAFAALRVRMPPADAADVLETLRAFDSPFELLKSIDSSTRERAGERGGKEMVKQVSKLEILDKDCDLAAPRTES